MFIILLPRGFGLFEKTKVVGDTRVNSLYGKYPFEDEGKMYLHFSDELLFTSYGHIFMRMGTPFHHNMTMTMEYIQAGGFPEYFIWMRMPVQAKDWGKNTSAAVLSDVILVFDFFRCKIYTTNN